MTVVGPGSVTGQSGPVGVVGNTGDDVGNGTS